MNEQRFVPSGWPRIIPRIIVGDVSGLAQFLREVFGATGDVPDGAPALLRIGESMIMVSDGGGVRGDTPAFLYVYVEDADATYARALVLGAHSVEAPLDMPYGDRRAMVEDRWGNTWQIATHRARA
jgi:uncharacterized glyoxalase superfamily protein PhnB